MGVACTSKRLYNIITIHPNFNYNKIVDIRKWEYKGSDISFLLHTFAIQGEERVFGYVHNIVGKILIVGYAKNESSHEYGSKFKVWSH